MSNLLKNWQNFPIIKLPWAKHFKKIDHYAYRSFNYNHLIRNFESLDFKVQSERYLFQNLDVEALWLKNPLPKKSPKHFNIYTSQYIGPLKLPTINSKKDYEDVYNQNPYLAWISIFDNHLNHIAFSCDNIYNTYDFIADWEKIASDIIESRDGQIKQFSTKPNMIRYEFPNGDIGFVPGVFFEFIQRVNEREGFEIGNSARIYESTK